MVRACSRRAAHPNKIGQTMVQFWVCGKWLVKAWSAVGDKIPADEPRAQVVLHLCARAPFAQLRLSSKGALVYASVKYILTQMVYSSWAIESLLDLLCSSFAQQGQTNGENDVRFVFISEALQWSCSYMQLYMMLHAYANADATQLFCCMQLHPWMSMDIHESP